LPVTLSTILSKIIEEKPISDGEGILHHIEGVDLMPANIELSGMEILLVNTMSREVILREYIDQVKSQYAYVLLDCPPSLGMLTINALAAADSVIIPTQTHFLSLKGLEQLLKTINRIKRQINPRLNIDGILLTMVDTCTNFAKEIATLLRENYGSKLKIFQNEIPLSIRAAEASAAGQSIYKYDPKGKVAIAYEGFTKEVLDIEKQCKKHKSDIVR
jgi:chromosome partitioning protein